MAKRDVLKTITHTYMTRRNHSLLKQNGNLCDKTEARKTPAADKNYMCRVCRNHLAEEADLIDRIEESGVFQNIVNIVLDEEDDLGDGNVRADVRCIQCNLELGVKCIHVNRERLFEDVEDPNIDIEYIRDGIFLLEMSQLVKRNGNAIRTADTQEVIGNM